MPLVMIVVNDCVLHRRRLVGKICSILPCGATFALSKMTMSKSGIS
jgi:hypothetical protein